MNPIKLQMLGKDCRALLKHPRGKKGRAGNGEQAQLLGLRLDRMRDMIQGSYKNRLTELIAIVTDMKAGAPLKGPQDTDITMKAIFLKWRKGWRRKHKDGGDFFGNETNKHMPMIGVIGCFFGTCLLYCVFCFVMPPSVVLPRMYAYMYA